MWIYLFYTCFSYFTCNLHLYMCENDQYECCMILLYMLSMTFVNLSSVSDICIEILLLECLNLKITDFPQIKQIHRVCTVPYP